MNQKWQKFDIHLFQDFLINAHGFVQQKDLDDSALCCERVVCRPSNTQ